MREPLGTVKCVGASRSKIVRLRVCQKRAQRVAQVQPRKMFAPREAHDPRRRPLLRGPVRAPHRSSRARARGSRPAYWRISMTRARHWRSSLVQGNPAMPGLLESRRAPPLHCVGIGVAHVGRCQAAVLPAGVRAWRSPRLARSSQRISADSRISARKMRIQDRRAPMGAARKIRASRSAPSSSAATMNSDFASACGSRKASAAAVRQQIAAAVAARSARCDPDRPTPTGFRSLRADRPSRANRAPSPVANCRNCAAPATGREHPP